MRRLLLTTALTIMAMPVFAEDAALILGVERYRNLDRFVGGAAVAGAAPELEAAGYAVDAISNQSAAEMRKLLNQFQARSADAERLVVAMSGRFATDGSRTWLLSVNAPEPTLFDIEQEGLSVESVLQVLATVPGQSVLLLAYDPSDTESYGPSMRIGLGDLDIPQGVTVIVGDPRQVRDLIEDTIVVPDAEIVSAFQEDRNIALFGYRPKSLVMQAGGEIADIKPTAPYIVDRIAENLQWEQAIGADTLEAYRAYMRAYPRGVHTRDANEAIAAILAEPDRAARLVEESLGLSRDQRREIQRDLSILNFNTRGIDGIFGNGTRAAISNWQQENGFAQTGYVTVEQITRIDAQAARRSAQLEAEAAREREAQLRLDRAYWEETGANGREPGLRSYLDRYPDGFYAERATTALAEIEQSKLAQAQRDDRDAWTAARRTDTVRSYDRYLAAQPNGAFRDEATARLNALRAERNGAASTNQAQAEEAALNLNAVTRRLIESRLTALGFEAGPVDGEFDGRTRRAIRQFQRSRNLDPTGYVNQAAVVQLLVRLKM